MHSLTFERSLNKTHVVLLNDHWWVASPCCGQIFNREQIKSLSYLDLTGPMFFHDLMTCHSNCMSRIALTQHLSPLIPQNRSRCSDQTASSMAFCSLCEVNGARGWCIHVARQDYKKSAANKGSGSSEYPGRQVGVATRTNQAVAPSRVWATQARNHNQGPQQVDAQHNSTLQEVTKNQNGLTIEGTFDFGYVDPSSTLPKYSAIIKTVNRNSASPSTSRLLEIKLASHQGNVTRSSMYVLHTSVQPMVLIVMMEYFSSVFRLKFLVPDERYFPTTL